MKARIEILADFADLQKLVAMLKGTAKTPAQGLTQLMVHTLPRAIPRRNWLTIGLA
jgi:hypothetical protein